MRGALLGEYSRAYKMPQNTKRQGKLVEAQVHTFRGILLALQSRKRN